MKHGNNASEGGAKRRQRGVGFFEIATRVCLFAAFAPVLYWLLDSLSQSQQLRDAIIILSAALVYFAIDGKISFHKPELAKSSIALLAVSYVLLIGAKYMGMWGAIAVFAGLSAAFTALGLACTNKPRYAYAAGFSFFAFAMLSLFIKLFDMPLRILAGKSAAWGLSLFNKSAFLVGLRGETPQMALMVDGRPYLVAAECNGFGIISSCLLLSLAAAVFRKNINWAGRALVVALCTFMGFLANSMRIVSITLAAPIAGIKYYDFVHEFFGYLFFIVAVLSVWFISSKAFAITRPKRGASVAEF